jgi:pantoate--beta-alanine ligase
MQRLAQNWQRKNIRIAFVPTMGYLHAGHIALVKRARQAVGKRGAVVVSIYVNPTQFAPQEDLSKYPRDFKRDRQLCRQAGVDVIFAPTDREMYPAGSNEAFSTYVVEERLSRGMEGASRPTHFRGVTTVVAKLFNIVLPDVAVFGAKDFQQAAVVQRMVRDLNFPLRMIVAPTKRERDGLAMSSRNKYLSKVERNEAILLFRLLEQARKAVQKRSLPAVTLKEQLKKTIAQHPFIRLDYLEFFDPITLTPVKRAQRGTQMALAAFLGKTRLIDNAKL